MIKWVLLLGLVGFVSFVNAKAENCYTGNTYTGWEYCADGCCGSYGNWYCCGPVAVWIIVVAVIGGIIFISVIVAVICYFLKTGHRKGQVVTPAPAADTEMQPVYTITHTPQYIQPTYVDQPPPYSHLQPTGGQSQSQRQSADSQHQPNDGQTQSQRQSADGQPQPNDGQTQSQRQSADGQHPPPVKFDHSYGGNRSSDGTF